MNNIKQRKEAELFRSRIKKVKLLRKIYQINFINNNKKKNMGKMNKKNLEKFNNNQKTNIIKEKDLI